LGWEFNGCEQTVLRRHLFTAQLINNHFSPEQFPFVCTTLKGATPLNAFPLRIPPGGFFRTKQHFFGRNCTFQQGRFSTKSPLLALKKVSNKHGGKNFPLFWGSPFCRGNLGPVPGGFGFFGGGQGVPPGCILG